MIRLREVRESDYDVLFRWTNNRSLRIMSAPFRPVSWKEHMSWLSGLLNDSTKELLIIEDQETEAPIGQILLTGISHVHRNCEFSIRIGEADYRGKGFGTAALDLMVDHAWNDLGLHRVELSVFADNNPARRAYEKAGFVVEGVKREAAFVDGAWRDVVIMSRLNPRS